jgi:hypothetical protein
MKKEEQFDKIVLDTTWAVWDTPEQYVVRISKDGKEWSQAIASGKGNKGITTITFPQQSARHIKIEQTGANPLYHWSIYEFDVFVKNKN